MPNHIERVTTNKIKGSVNVIVKPIITFEVLWNNYPSSRLTHSIDGNGTDFSNHCAINVSHSLYLSGILLKAYPSKRKCWGCPTPDSQGRGVHALAAQELADYLKKSPFAGCPKPISITPSALYDGIAGKKGIVFFKNYWARSSDSDGNRTGDHIDLWDGNELASLGFLRSGFRRYFPSFSEEIGMSDFSRSTEILFWELNK